jgi:hypothetical protein
MPTNSKILESLDPWLTISRYVDASRFKRGRRHSNIGNNMQQ